MKLRNICFTINNYTDIDVQALRNMYTECCKYIICGLEVGESGTPHIQGYAEFKDSMELHNIKKHMPRAHIEKRKGTAEQADMYCQKDGRFWALGSRSQQGSREDIRIIKDMIYAGATKQQILDDYPHYYFRYHKIIKELIDDYGAIEVKKELTISDYEGVQWKSWQQRILTMIQGQPSNREIHWWYDTIGNTGKSFLTTYMILQHNAYLITGGSKSDIFYAYDSQPIVVFDLARDFQADEKKYIFDVMENFKNGRFFSGKYESKMKIFKKPHVFIFANFPPSPEQMKLLSQDRWDIYNVHMY